MRKLEDEGEKIHKFWRKEASYFLCIISKTLLISEYTYKQPPVIKNMALWLWMLKYPDLFQLNLSRFWNRKQLCKSTEESKKPETQIKIFRFLGVQKGFSSQLRAMQTTEFKVIMIMMIILIQFMSLNTNRSSLGICFL